ncbi:acetylglutamate kinase [Lentilactobacillus sp. Marseille-Q4993]|uniref:acetylglutamate kinase n=1 Tax=Lentilactobacillus sp. Marseille-Q4993 TaxID=3039492 RepID=UPI0024BC036C|nr:acetylglutamate kinase [Lentilactobacillus sp. Marseille-Q4993]
MKPDVIIVKVGGQAVEELDESFFDQIKTWQVLGNKVIIVHGGGPQISSLISALNIDAPKIDGVRVTNDAAISIVESVLIGMVQPKLLAKLGSNGIDASSLNTMNFNHFEGQYLNFEKFGLVGELTKVWIKNEELNDPSVVSVVAPIINGTSGKKLNVNADTFAAALAKLIAADKLLFLTDVPGVMKEHKTIANLSETEATQLYDLGIITDGMMPKIQAAIDAFKAGVGSVQIKGNVMGDGTEIVAMG